jgi:hypothetical protein
MGEWSPVISFILAECDACPLPLAKAEYGDVQLAKVLRESSPPESLFPNARNPAAAYSALLLLLGYWEESHDLIDEDETPEGCYLHAIVHRVEPNPGNSAYWFRQVGEHPLFAQLRPRAQQILNENPVPDWQLKNEWDPYLFNRWCEEARNSLGGAKRKAALAIQRAEWDLLFAWCAAPVG